MSPQQRILVLCPDWDFPSGGVRKLYRHVEVLRKHGLNAFVEHQTSGFRCNWFEHDTPIADPRDSWPPRPIDIVCCPEQVAWQMVGKTPGVPKVVFNQNVYLTFDGKSAEFNVVPYTHRDFVATIVVSEDSRAYLNYAFPELPVFRVHNSVNPDRFYFQPEKKRRIALMPRKNAADATQVLLMLKCRGTLDGFEPLFIQKMSEEQTAAALRESLIFLSLSTREGSPMPPLEAMACGCITIGYDGLGGREYVNAEYAFPVRQEDVLGFAQTLERVIRQVRERPGDLAAKRRRAAQFVGETHSPGREEQDIIAAWEQVLRMLPGWR